MSAPRNNRLGQVVVGVIGLFGLWVLVDGATRGESQHRAFSVVLGLLFLLPMMSSLIFRARAFHVMKLMSFAAIPLLFVLGVLEVGARILDVETLLRPERRSHPVLDYEMVPGSGELDRLGFRNAEVPDTTEVVILGDSMTYGFNVTRSNAYPNQFADLSSREVYNMGVGAYGPLQYLALLTKALSFQPQAVVVAVYIGNDLTDAFVTARLEAWSDIQDPEVEYLTIDRETASTGRNLGVNLMLAIERNSKLIGLASREMRLLFATRQMLSGLHSAEPGSPLYESETISTLFTPLRRTLAMDAKIDAVVDGERITSIALGRIGRETIASGAVPVLLLIHTKEFYYCRMMAELGETVPLSMETVDSIETVAASRLLDVAGGAGFVLVDPTEQMVRALLEERAVYPTNSDGHPTALGHAVLARVLFDSSTEWLQPK